MSNSLAPVARQRELTDLGVVAPGALLHTYVSGTPATPIATASDAAGLVPNANPIVASAGGLLGPIYLVPNLAYRFVLTEANGVAIWDQDPVMVESAAGGFSTVLDVRTYGAIGNGVTDDTSAIQAAITAAVTNGGTVFLGPGTYKLTAALTIAMLAPTVNIRIVGSGTATILAQATVGADIFKVGTNGAEHADNLYICDLMTTGGRYALNLNNALQGVFERLTFATPVVGIYLQGTNESHTFRNIQITGASLHGIWGGNLNGGPGVVLDAPEVQKCLFQRIRVAGTTGGTAILMTAGFLGSQFQSGHNRFEQILLESNAKGSLEIDFAFNTVVDGLSTEDAPDANNTYSSILIDNGSTVYLAHLLIGKGSGANNFKYYLNVASGSVFVTDAILCGGGAAATTDVFATGTLALTNCNVTNAAGVGFVSTAAKQRSFLIGVRDAAGVSIEFTDTIYGALSRSNTGMSVPGDLQAQAMIATGGGNPGTSGSLRVRSAPSGGVLVGRDAGNTNDYILINWGSPSANEPTYGNVGTRTSILSALLPPAVPQDGAWWVEFTGVTPNRQLRIAVRDGGVTYYQNIGALH